MTEKDHRLKKVANGMEDCLSSLIPKSIRVDNDPILDHQNCKNLQKECE